MDALKTQNILLFLLVILVAGFGLLYFQASKDFPKYENYCRIEGAITADLGLTGGQFPGTTKLYEVQGGGKTEVAELNIEAEVGDYYCLEQGLRRVK